LEFGIEDGAVGLPFEPAGPVADGTGGTRDEGGCLLLAGGNGCPPLAPGKGCPIRSLLRFGGTAPGPPFAAGVAGATGLGCVPIGGCFPFNAGLVGNGCAPAGGCLPFNAGLAVGRLVVPGVDCCVFCVRRKPPGASGFAGGAGCGLGVVAALAARAEGRAGASTAAAPAAPMAAAVTPALVPEGGGGGGAAGGGPPGLAGATAATAAAGVMVCAWPCGLVIVTMLVVLLITTWLWMLL
jgi:hypothetical protein